MHGLVLHIDLLFQLKVALAKDEDLPLEGDVDVRGGADCREDLNSLTLAVDRCNQAEIVRAEEVDLV